VEGKMKSAQRNRDVRASGLKLNRFLAAVQSRDDIRTLEDL